MGNRVGSTAEKGDITILEAIISLAFMAGWFWLLSPDNGLPPENETFGETAERLVFGDEEADKDV